MGITNPSLIAPDFVVYEKDYQVDNSGNTMIAQGNPQRVALIFASLTTQNLYMSTRSGNTASTGLVLAGTTTYTTLTFYQVGGLVSLPWYSYFNGLPSGSANLTVFEVLYYPPDITEGDNGTS